VKFIKLGVMKFIQVKVNSNRETQLCLTSKELKDLLRKNIHRELDELVGQNIDHDKQELIDKAFESGKRSANTKMYEYYEAILFGYHYFEREYEFCFNLKSSFDVDKSRINSIMDLDIYKVDPPDIIILYKGSFHYFELKRYKDEINQDALLSFVMTKILKHYQPNLKYNYLILLQSPQAFVGDKVFETLHHTIQNQELMKGFLGNITFCLNDNNEKHLYIRVWPEFYHEDKPFVSMSKIFSDVD
jgi:hypothetical protein